MAAFEVFQVRLKPELKAKLKAQAFHEDISMTKLLNRILTLWYDAQKQESQATRREHGNREEA